MSLNSRSPSREERGFYRHRIKTISMADRSETPSAVSRDVLLETVARMSAESLSLMARRSEINRRIRDFHHVLRGLNNLLNKTNGCTGFAANTVDLTADRITNSPPCQSNSPGECVTMQRRLRQPRVSKYLLARMQRACRIALMEAGGTASLAEIRALIVRRGSFAFSASDSFHSAILQTLTHMGVSGEVRCLKDHPQPVWERITHPEEIDFPS